MSPLKLLADFEKAYMDMMVDNHHKGIAEFEKVGRINADSDVKSFASKTLPRLKKTPGRSKKCKR